MKDPCWLDKEFDKQLREAKIFAEIRGLMLGMEVYGMKDDEENKYFVKLVNNLGARKFDIIEVTPWDVKLPVWNKLKEWRSNDYTKKNN